MRTAEAKALVLLASAVVVLGAFARVDDLAAEEPVPARTSASPVPISGPLAPYPMRLWTLQFVDEQHGFVTASLGSDWTLLRTQNGGATWTKNALPASVADLQFVSPLAGWLLTSGCTATNGKLSVSCRAALLRTADGGQTWTQLIERSGPGLGSGPWSSARFIDERTGWVLEEADTCKPVACRNVLRTSDGGHSWTAMTREPLAVSELIPVDATHLWSFGAAGVLFSDDGGSTWASQLDVRSVAPREKSLRGIDFVDARHGWALAFDGATCTASSCAGYALYATEDGGANWRVRATGSSFDGCGGQLTTPRFVDRMVGWIGGNHGAGGVGTRWGVLVTTNGGQNWTCHSSSIAFDVIEPLDESRAWAIAERRGVSVLLRTNSGGSMWAEVFPQASAPSAPAIPASRSVVVAGSVAPATASTTATATPLWTVSALAVDRRGDIFIAELSGCAKAQYCGSRVRRVDARSGSIEIVAGTGIAGYEYDNKRCCRGRGTDATTTYLGLVNALALDRLGRLYIGASDPLGYGAVWRVDPDSKRIEVIAGDLDGPTSQTRGHGDAYTAVGTLLFSVWSLAVDDEGNVFVGDGGGYRVRKVSIDGTIRTVAGTGNLIGYAEPGHAGTDTAMYGASALALDRDGSLYFAERTANRVRRLDTPGIIRAVAGTGEIGAPGDGLPATLARVNEPNALAIDSRGRLYIADASAIRRVEPDGTIRTMLQLENTLTPTSLTSVSALAIGADDALYVAGGTYPLVRKVVFEE